MTLRKIFISVWVGSTLLASAHAAEYRVRQITNQDGLTNSSVNMIFQDHSGRVWFGTWDGLDRYDGVHIRSFFPAAGNPATLSNNVIREMVELPDGSLWVATDRGVDCYSPESERFRRFFPDAQISVAEHSFHLAAGPDGTVTALVDGHGLFALRDSVFVRTAPLPVRKILQVAVDREGRLWMLGEDGRVFCDKAPVLDGVDFLYYDAATQQVWVQDASGYHALDGPAFSLPGARIRCAASDGAYQYLGTSQGLFRLDPSGGALSCILPDVPVLSVACGIQGIVWVGTDMHGVWQLSPLPYDLGAQTGLFGGNAVRCFVQEPSGKLAVGTKGSGIYLFSADTRLAGRLTTADGLLHNAVYCLQDDGEVVWIGTDGKGLNYQDKHSRQLMTLRMPDSLQVASVYAIQPMGRDTLWVGTSGHGLFRLSLDRSTHPFRVRESRQYTPEQLGNGVVYSLLPTWHGSLFVGTRGAGLQIVRRETDQLSRLLYAVDDDILCLARGSDASLWVGTSMGLYRYGQGWEDVTRYSMEDGLPSNTIHGILEDSAGEIWVSTNNGLARLRQEDRRIVTYHLADGLQDNEFSDGAYYSYGGWFFFGGIKGFNAFDPLAVGKVTFMPNLVLDEVYVDNERRLLQDLLQEDRGRTKLLLDAGNRSLSLHFVPIDYLQAQDCELTYRMLGLSDKWIRLGDSHVVAFSNLPPGDYTLEVRCSNADKEWGPQVFSLPVRKLAPWWRTLLAQYLYAAALLLLLLYVVLRIRLYIRRQRREQAAKAERQQAEAVHEAKLDFFTNIAHEFSNSLTLIYGPCQALKQSARMTGTEERYLNSILSNSDRMRGMIQQLISFRKAETGHLSIRIGKVDLVALIAQETSYFREQMARSEVTFTLDAPPEGLIWTADGDSMEKIVFNLLSNAVKYTPARERIRIVLNPHEDRLEMDVTNTGVGIPLDKQASLFDRYEVLTRFEKALAKGRTSNGIGLSLCKSLVELHKGSIDLRSDGSTYTTFHLELPLLPVETDALYQIHKEEVPAGVEADPVAEELPLVASARDLVLVVDDEPDIRAFLRKTLEPEFAVVEAGNGQEALALLAQELPKVVVSDLSMPGMDGAAFLKALRADPRTRHIPFILLSGQGTDKTPIEALESGADAYLDKPFHPRHLLARIHRLLGRDAEVIAYSQSARAAVGQFAGKEMKKADRELLQAITEVILSRLDDESLSGAQVAQAVSISEMQLYRKLKALVEMTPTEYIRSLRLDRAAQLLVSGNKTVQEIMYACGFVTKTYFFREFSRRFGVSPGEYRRQSQ